MEWYTTFLAHSVDVSAEISDQVTRLSSVEQGRKSVLISLVEVSSKVLDQASNYINVAT
jgi:hypothetical protein